MAFCLADLGEAYLVYLPYGGWVDLDFEIESDHNFHVLWLDPRSGEEYPLKSRTLSGSDRHRFNPPQTLIPLNDPGDWVLYLYKQRSNLEK